jgi:hypothetical protein
MPSLLPSGVTVLSDHNKFLTLMLLVSTAITMVWNSTQGLCTTLSRILVVMARIGCDQRGLRHQPGCPATTCSPCSDQMESLGDPQTVLATPGFEVRMLERGVSFPSRRDMSVAMRSVVGTCLNQ